MPKKEIVQAKWESFAFSGILAGEGRLFSQTKKHEKICHFACDCSRNLLCGPRGSPKYARGHKPPGLP